MGIHLGLAKILLLVFYSFMHGQILALFLTMCYGGVCVLCVSSHWGYVSQCEPPQVQYEEFPFLEKDSMMDYSSMQRLGAKLG